MANASNIKKYRDYHEYLLKEGYTVVGNKYYKDGFFFEPRFYNNYSCLKVVGTTLQIGEEVEQMLYAMVEGGTF